MTPVNTRALVTLMRNAIWRERDICYRIMWTLKLLQTTQSSISCMSNLFVMSRKLILLESRSPRPGHFCNFSTGSGESLIFQLFPQIINVIKGKVGLSISTIIIIAPLVAIMKCQAQAIWKNTSNSHRLGAGGRHWQRHGNVGKVWDY